MSSTMNMAFLSSFQTRQILFYLTVVCNLATCSFSSSQRNEEPHMESGCRYSYPSYINPYTQLTRIDLISCRNMLIHELPFYENITTMELLSIPLTVLNDSEIPFAIQSPRVDLKRLHWTKSYIKVIEKIPMQNLVELDLSWNLVQEIHTQAFKSLTQLTQLNISHNNIEFLPDNLFNEHNSIRVFSLAYNEIKMLPQDLLNHLTHLEILDLSNNNLKHLKETLFYKTTHLNNLNLSHNRLTLIPSKLFDPLLSLKYLSLEANQLFNIEPNTFANQHELMVLNLGENPLLSLPNTLLPPNNSLFVLTISHTKVLKIKPTLLQNLHLLRNLYLTDNRHLQNLHNDTFVNNKELKVIHLQNNNFTQLPFSVLDTEPEDLQLDGNPWPCDCSTQWIIFWAYGSDIRSASEDGSQLTAYCNTTERYLINALRRLHCKPLVLRISPIRYESLEAKVKLMCRSYAYPPTTISWQTPKGNAYVRTPDDGVKVNYEETKYHQSQYGNHQYQQQYAKNVHNADGNIYVHENGDLHIKQMSRDDAGEYTCVVANKMGESQAYTRLYVDPSIMQRIKTGSIICGLLWVNTFLLFSIVYLLIRRYSRRAKQEKRKRRMHENMDIYKSQQIARLRERSKNQMNRIKNNCSIQVDWIKDNFVESMNNLQDHRPAYLTTQYNLQMSEIREYYLTQMQKVCENFDQQRKLINEFSINRVSNCDSTNVEPEVNSTHPPTTAATTANDLTVKIENGTATMLTSSLPSASIEEDDIYHYNEQMRSEIRKLTSLRNLYEAFSKSPMNEDNSNKEESFKFGTAAPSTSNKVTVPIIAANNNGISQFNKYADNVANNKFRVAEDEGDEKTSMLTKEDEISH